MTDKKIEKMSPRLLQGFRDFLPEKKVRRDWLIKTVSLAYESFGFQPLETPVLEFADILTGKYGEEANLMMYRFKDQGDRDVAMRYDLTIPFARVIAQYPELTKPFKRYQVAPVWRSDSPQAGRYREFYQMDVDTAGSNSSLADTEIVQLIYTAMTKLGMENFNIRLNNRKILNGLLEVAEIDQTKANKVFQLIDKTEKISPEDFEKSLLDVISQNQTQKVLDFMSLKGENSEILTKLKTMFDKSKTGLEGVAELEKVLTYLKSVQIDSAKIKIDLSIARGLDYYTGLVFETIVLDAPKMGSVFSGGRYDELIGLFTGTDIPAVGVSCGVDRLFAVMEKLEKLPKQTQNAEILVTVFPENPEISLKVAEALRTAGIKTELYLGEKESLSPQLAYANKLSIPVVVITFPDQTAKDNYTVKKMTQSYGESEQTETSFGQLVETVKKSLG
jgi:histidyl-tRNA synthetase